ncbi:terpenoid synthase [Exidia glandulosa HHB12029]|uniref:Terpene synthase n=1 Tax=Exidia glandulosa HHB12029 TaxID=1314781 RepID=A0A165J832_EXIGL|nr:terpenoid synthase [Exidia glandulosa HHB12029]
MVGSATADAFDLPDLVAASSSFTPCFNSHYARAMADCRAWLVSREALGAQTEAILVNADMERLCAMCYPSAPYDRFRAVCDFVCILVVVDEVCDTQSGVEAYTTGQSFLNALREPNWDDGSKLARITREFRASLGNWIDTDGGKRFINVCESYIACVVEEANLRERGEVLSVEAYENLRRENSAVRPCASIMEFSLGISLPNHVFANEHFMAVYWSVIDMVCWANDVYSYAVEYQYGLEGNNVVTVLMSERNIDLQAASDHVGEYYESLVKKHWAAREVLRGQTFGSAELDSQVQLYVEELAHWTIGNIMWSFEIRRYFGDEAKKVKESRRVVVKAKEQRDMITELV